jgi:histidine ammonia-lyase
MIEITGDGLTIEALCSVARERIRVAQLGDQAQAKMQASWNWVDQTVRSGREVIYGVNTGFGPLATRRIAPEQARTLSRNVILNCVAGVGPPLPQDVVRGMMVMRANNLAKGVSGVRPVVVETLIRMLNAGVTPYVPSKGSLGASGDLAPLAHIAVVLTRDVEGEDGGYSGRAWFGDELMSGEQAMRRAGIPRLVPQAKEGLALTNGTNYMVAAGALLLHDTANLLSNAEIAGALSLEGLRGLTEALHPALHEANNQPGQIRTAANLRALLHGSRLTDSDPERVQDAYSLRCIPQVIGPVRDVLAFLRDRFNSALNAATDNPLIFVDLPGGQARKALSGGNFHGQGPAMWLDFLGIAAAEMGSISERRTFRLLTPELSGGLPAMLVQSGGLDSGLMIPQYTAAALVSENKTLVHPDSVDSIPSSGNQEDHVSMGANAARHAWEVVSNVRHILAIELLTAAQAVDLHPDGPARLGRGTAVAYTLVRSKVRTLEHDRQLTPDIEALADLVHSGKLVAEVGRALNGEFEV